MHDHALSFPDYQHPSGTPPERTLSSGCSNSPLHLPAQPTPRTRTNHCFHWAKRIVVHDRPTTGPSDACAHAAGRSTIPATCSLPSLGNRRFSSGGPLARGLPRACAPAFVVVMTFICGLIQRRLKRRHLRFEGPYLGLGTHDLTAQVLQFSDTAYRIHECPSPAKAYRSSSGSESRSDGQSSVEAKYKSWDVMPNC